MAGSKSKKSFVKMKKIKAHLVECRKTQKLDLSSLELTDIPEDLMNLVKGAGVTSIIELDLRSNKLSELTHELAEFRTLRCLRLGKNHFQFLPPVVLRYGKIQILDLSDNEIKELDQGIQYLVSLREMNFSKNQLMTLPTFWGQLILLVSLNLAKNRLLELPDSLGLLRNLQRLDVSENLLSTLPKPLEDLQELVTLDVHGNHLTEVPPSLGLLKNLTEFDCTGNPFSEPINTFYSQGFEKFMDYLRNLHELHQLEQLIFQKPEAELSGFFKKYLTRYENGQRPLLRSGYSITQAGPITYIFGGRITNYVKVEDIFAIDSRTLLWVKLSPSGNIPTARDGHSAAFDGNKRLYIFGGRNEENKLLNDVYYLDLKTMTWFQPPIEGSIPLTREGASMAVIGSQLIVFGGRGSRQRYNDVHVLDTQVWVWTLQNTKGSIPAPRQNAASTSFGTKFYVHGGRGGGLMLDDLHVLETVGFTWSRVSQKGSGPCPRFKHSCWIYQNRLYVVGGIDVKGEPLSSLCVLPLGIEVKNDLKVSTNITISSVQEKDPTYLRNHTWTELKLGITPCLTNVFCYCDEKIVVLQEGTQYLHATPPAVEETASLDGVSWDYYLEAVCDALPPKVGDIQTDKPLQNKTARILFLRQTQTAIQMLQLPKSFRILSDKESHLLEHIKNYERRFMQRYRDRRPFMFAALNECDIVKCICTTIRPSHSDYVEFFQWESCASFLANFITYEPLENPIMFPSYLPSPISVLNAHSLGKINTLDSVVKMEEWRRADCFDFAVILTSFLSGAGYEAFCVVGYAPLHITTNNQEYTTCPYIQAKENEPCHEKENLHPSQKTDKANIESDYIQESSPILNEQFLNLHKQDRGTLVWNFIQGFKGIYEHGVHLGQNEEEDNLFTYCNERVPYEVLDEERIKQMEMENTTCILPEQNAAEVMSGISNTASESLDVLDKKRLHCWVLVTSNKRDISENFFIEPSTGYRYELYGSPYQAVEYIWNQHNIFINMQSNPSRSGLDSMSWELGDTRKWERVLDSFLSGGMQTESSNVSSNMECSTTLATKSNSKAGIAISKDGIDKLDLEDVTKNGFLKPYHWLLPPSWVPSLMIPIEAYITRCPKGAKRTYYHRCSHELYSFYGDFVRWDGLIERIILYEDDERTNVSEIHDYFQRRKDALRKRIFIPNLNKVHDFFDAGASFSLKETEIIDGESRKFLFYENCRNDGLISREEIIGKKIVERFFNQEDCLIYRCVCYGPPKPPTREEQTPKALNERHLESDSGMRGDGSTKGSVSRPGSVRLEGSSRAGRMSVDSLRSRTRSRVMSRWQGSPNNRNKLSTASSDKQEEKKLLPIPKRRIIAEKLLPIIKISLKYEQRNGTRQKDNVAKYVFKLSTDEIRVDYHHIERHITHNSRMYKKDGSLTLMQVDPFSPAMTSFEKLDEYNTLLSAEREAIKSVRDIERDTEEILQQRLREEQNVVLITPYIDIACVKQDDLFQEGEDAIKLTTDYLSSFLPSGVRPRQKLTREQMLEVRDKCLGALKERLVNRATIIQSRYDEETSALSKRRTNFERDREQMTVEDEETYNQDCDNALFRIRILELRAKLHEDEAMKKYVELEKKLQNDPRIAPLYRSS